MGDRIKQLAELHCRRVLHGSMTMEKLIEHYTFLIEAAKAQQLFQARSRLWIVTKTSGDGSEDTIFNPNDWTTQVGSQLAQTISMTGNNVTSQTVARIVYDVAASHGLTELTQLCVGEMKIRPQSMSRRWRHPIGKWVF